MKSENKALFAVVFGVIPFVIYGSNSSIAKFFAAPGDLVPQNAMVMAFLILLASVVICWSISIFIVFNIFKSSRSKPPVTQGP